MDSIMKSDIKINGNKLEIQFINSKMNVLLLKTLKETQPLRWKVFKKEFQEIFCDAFNMYQQVNKIEVICSKGMLIATQERNEDINWQWLSL